MTTCTGMPASAAALTASVAVSVFPSPVCISAICPASSTRPPTICSGKCRWPMARSAASRTSANVWLTSGSVNPCRRSSRPMAPALSRSSASPRTSNPAPASSTSDGKWAQRFQERARRRTAPRCRETIQAPRGPSLRARLSEVLQVSRAIDRDPAYSPAVMHRPGARRVLRHRDRWRDAPAHLAFAQIRAHLHGVVVHGVYDAQWPPSSIAWSGTIRRRQNGFGSSRGSTPELNMAHPASRTISSRPSFQCQIDELFRSGPGARRRHPGGARWRAAVRGGGPRRTSATFTTIRAHLTRFSSAPLRQRAAPRPIPTPDRMPSCT